MTRLWLAMLGRDLLSAPLAMAISCAGAWFLYMLLSAVFARAGLASENALRTCSRVHT